MLVISIEFYIMQVSLLLPSNEFYVTQQVPKKFLVLGLLESEIFKAINPP